MKGGRSPRFRVQEPARRRPISAFCRNRPQTGDKVASLRRDKGHRPLSLLFIRIKAVLRVGTLLPYSRLIKASASEESLKVGFHTRQTRGLKVMASKRRMTRVGSLFWTAEV